MLQLQPLYLRHIFAWGRISIVSCILNYKLNELGILKKEELKIYSETLMARTPFGTMRICSRQGWFELVSVNHSARIEGKIEISFRFFLI